MAAVQGICNVIECAKCGVWWNWRTRETGKSGTDLKARARAMGTLWEQGELQYQMELERRQPDEFKKLLERNGMVSTTLTDSLDATCSAAASRSAVSFSPLSLRCDAVCVVCAAGVRSQLQAWWLVAHGRLWKA